MRIRKFASLGAALVVSLSSLFAINFGTALATANNCTWTGATNDNFNTSTNWSNCNSTAPQTGDNLIFDNTSLSSVATLNNDITSLSVGSIDFTGNNSTYSFELTGNAMTVNSGISDNTTSFGSPEISLNVTLGADQTFTSNNFLIFSGGNSISLGGHALTLAGASDGTMEMVGTISGAGSIIDNVADHVALDGDNSTFTGNITINSGVLFVAGPPSLGAGSGTTTVTTGAAVYIDTNADTTVGENFNLSGNGLNDGYTGTLNAGYSGNYTTTLTGNITLGSNIVYAGTDNAKLTGNLTANGHSISVLDGNQGNITTPDGKTTEAPVQTTTIAASDSQPSSPVSVGKNQTFVIDGTRGDVDVQNAGVLKGSGTVGDTTVDQGGTIAPGHSPGCMNTSDLTITGTYQAEIGGTTACSGYDQLNVTGTVTLTDSGSPATLPTLSTILYNNYKPKAGETYTIIKNDGSDAVTGTFNGLAEGATFTVSGFVFQITYKGGDGNDVVLSVKSVPATPNTGLGFSGSNPLLTLGLTSASAASIYGLSRRYRKLVSARRG